MKKALVGIGRMENRYAREWVEHHLKVGFDHILIADNNHEGEERFEDVLQDYVDRGLVTILNYRNQTAVQNRTYNDVYQKYQDTFDWMAFFDFDEFLDIREGTLEDLLDTAEDVVLVNWECYGDNGLVHYDERPCWKRFKKPLPHPLYVQYKTHAENDHVKSIIRCWAPSINFYRNPHVIGEMSPFRAYDPKAKAVLRHYITKTAEEWLWRSKRGSGNRTLAVWRNTYAGRFFKYNERTEEKSKIMSKERTVAIVNYNTPELTTAAIMSLRKHGGQEWRVVVFDNSDERPFTQKMKNVEVIDNTKGQIIDFEKELAKFANKVPECGVDGKCVFGSDKHMMSIQALFDLLPDGFLLMDSDILLTRDVDFMFQNDQCVVGHIQTKDKTKNPYGIERLVPMLCYINVPMCKACGISYWDPNRSWQLHGKTKNSWYDTGASFLEDVRSHKRGAHGKRIDIRPLMVHLKSGSWRNEHNAKAWLHQNRELWVLTDDEMKEWVQVSKPGTRKRPNRKRNKI
jgi:hypothetical protein